MSRARATGALLILAGLVLLGCQLFERTAPHASQDVLDAIYAGMKRAPNHPS